MIFHTVHGKISDRRPEPIFNFWVKYYYFDVKKKDAHFFSFLASDAPKKKFQSRMMGFTTKSKHIIVIGIGQHDVLMGQMPFRSMFNVDDDVLVVFYPFSQKKNYTTIRNSMRTNVVNWATQYNTIQYNKIKYRTCLRFMKLPNYQAYKFYTSNTSSTDIVSVSRKNLSYLRRRRRRTSLCLILAGLLLLCNLIALNPIVFAFHQQQFVYNNNNNKFNKLFAIRIMVSLSGQASLSFRRSRMAKTAIRAFPEAIHTNNNKDLHRPADPQSMILNPDHLEEKASELAKWLSSKSNVFCLTGAGLSTDSGIPDYRGHKGSYHVGHKPIIHQQFMDSPHQRRRYWGRSMVGWKLFDMAKPNKGHYALAALERMGRLGVDMEDRAEFYDDRDRDDFLFTSGQRRLSILTQNVDSLHDRAGSKDILAIHGGNKLVRCMNCGHRMARNDYQNQLEETNRLWLNEHVVSQQQLKEEDDNNESMRPDGDAELSQQANYDEVHLPSCPCCNNPTSGFFKPEVVFFGDSVPKHRVTICQQAVEQCDGILVVGSSLAVHSAFRHVRAASKKGVSVAILNVGETRAEAEGLEGLVKIEAPIGDTLEQCVKLLGNNSNNKSY